MILCAALAGAIQAGAAPPSRAVASAKAHHHAAKHKPKPKPRFVGVHVSVPGIIRGTRTTITVRVAERQRILYTVRVQHGNGLALCDGQEEVQARGRPGHTATFHIRVPGGERWCVGRWSVRVLHVTFGPDPCLGDEICRDSPPEFDRLLGGAHFRLVRA
jgi:hypothetical protein